MAIAAAKVETFVCKQATLFGAGSRLPVRNLKWVAQKAVAFTSRCEVGAPEKFPPPPAAEGSRSTNLTALEQLKTSAGDLIQSNTVVNTTNGGWPCKN